MATLISPPSRRVVGLYLRKPGECSNPRAGTLFGNGHFRDMSESCRRVLLALATPGLCLPLVVGVAYATPVAPSGFLFDASREPGLILIRGGHGKHKGHGHHGRAHRHAGRWNPRRILDRQVIAIGRLHEPIFGSGQRYLSSYDIPEYRSIGPTGPAIATEPTPAAEQHKPVSCEAASGIVSDYAFARVTPVSCSGTIYQFRANRGDSAYSVTLDAANGELVRVQKLAGR